jgi:hypothetical protein
MNTETSSKVAESALDNYKTVASFSILCIVIVSILGCSCSCMVSKNEIRREAV